MPPTELDRLTNAQIEKLLLQGNGVSQKIVAAYEKELLRHYQKALKEILSQIAAMFEKYGDKVNLADMDTYNRLTNLEQRNADEVRRLNGRVRTTTQSAIQDIYSQSFYYTGYALETSFGTGLNFGQLRTEDISRSIFNPLDRIKWTKRQLLHHQTYIRHIREEITQGLIQGKGYGPIAREIRNKTGRAAGKITRIVQTETHRVQNQGIIDAYKKSEGAFERLGIKKSKIWAATLDSKTRDQHQDMDGRAAEVIDGVEIFTLPDGSTGESPGNIGVPHHDINCRCNTSIEIKGYEPSVRKDNESGKIISYKTYHEWATGKNII